MAIMPSGEVNAAKTHCLHGHEFNTENTYVDNLDKRHCKTCHRVNVNHDYTVKPDVLKKRVYGRKAEYRRRVNTLKTVCAQCPETATECLDFHHRDPKEKYQSVSWLISNGRPWALIETEMTKCDVLCSNCHRKLEAKRRMERYRGICDVSQQV